MKDNNSKPLASRSAPKMEQAAALKAGVYHVLPVLEEGITYSIERVSLNNPEGVELILVATDLHGKHLWKRTIHQRSYEPFLEMDVQHVFVVDLYVKENKVYVKLEYSDPIMVDKRSGRLY